MSVLPATVEIPNNFTFALWLATMIAMASSKTPTSRPGSESIQISLGSSDFDVLFS